MPIYEYRGISENPCRLCQSVFETRQRMGDNALDTCPNCSQPVQRVFSRSFIATIAPLSTEETFHTHTEDEADRRSLSGGFAPDEIWG